MNRLIKQLIKELKRSPVKAAALAGGLLLAVWFWLPLLGEWFGGEAAPGGATAPPAAVPVAGPPPAAGPAVAAAPAAADVPPIEWREIVAWQKSNGYTRSYNWHEDNRNPFVATETQFPVQLAETHAEDQQIQQQLARELATEQFANRLQSLQLTSTLIMPRGRSATINGKVYREGEPIDMELDAGEEDNTAGPETQTPPDESDPLVVVLRHIEPESVTLQHGNELIPLQLKQKTNKSIRLELR